jgi:hypothetical protein
MRLRRNAFAAATWSGSPRSGPDRPPSDRRRTPAPSPDQRVSDDWAGRPILVGGAEQIELHPCDIVPAAVFPFDAPV